MLPVIYVIHDTRRAKKEGVYPLKLRVYYKYKTILYPLIYNLSKEDYERFGSKRLPDELLEIQEKVRETELLAKVAAKKIEPFDNDRFYESFIRNNPRFNVRDKPLKQGAQVGYGLHFIPEEWKRKFPIFAEAHPGPEYISAIFSDIIKSLMCQARIGTADSYKLSYNSLKAFAGNIKVTAITPQLLREYEGWMIYHRKNSKTTVGIYTRVIRAVINEAIDRKLMDKEDYPFGRRRYRCPSGRNIKKALGKEAIAKLYYTSPDTISKQKAKDFWFFSFYGNGMNVKDIIQLKYKNIQGEFLVFERAKTELTTRGSDPIVISCFLHQEMVDIIERWGNKEKSPENYIFPILKAGLTPLQEYNIKRNFTKFINKNMEHVRTFAAVDKKVKTMETRHSASTMMKNAGVSPHFIKESLGHASLKTTENYLARFENEQRKEFSKVLDGFKKND